MSNSHTKENSLEKYKPDVFPKTLYQIAEHGQGKVFACADNKVCKVIADEPNKQRGRHLYEGLDHPNILKFDKVRPATPEKFSEMKNPVKCYSERFEKNAYEALKNGPLSQEEATKFMTQTLDGVNYLNQKSIIHCDLKTSNIMLNKNGNYIIIDQDSSRRPSDLNQICKTDQYAAPEIYERKINGEKYDAFCVGMALAESVLGLDEFPKILCSNRTEKLKQIRIIRKKIENANIRPALRQRILDLLEVDVKDRCNVAEAHIINQGDEKSKMMSIKEHKVKKANQKATQQGIYPVFEGLANVAANIVKNGSKIDARQDIVHPIVNTGIRVGQIANERALRVSVKSEDLRKKVGFGNKAKIAVGGAAVTEMVNQFFFTEDRHKTSFGKKIINIAKETVLSGIEYSASYVGAKVVNQVFREGVKKVANYGTGKGITTGTSLLLKAGSPTVSNVVLVSGALGIVSATVGIAVDGLRILMNNQENKKEALVQAVKTNAVATVGQTIGAAVGSFAGPLGTVFGGILGAAVVSYVLFFCSKVEKTN